MVFCIEKNIELKESCPAIQSRAGELYDAQEKLVKKDRKAETKARLIRSNFWKE